MKALFALNPYFWRYRWHLILGIIFVVISNLFMVYPAQIVRSAIDMVGDIIQFYSLFDGFEIAADLRRMLMKSLMLFGGLVLLMAVLRGVFLFFTRQTIIVMSRLIEYDLRDDLYKHFQGLSLSFYRRNRTGDLMARITEDVSRVRMYLGPGVMYSINTISLFFVVVTTMFMVNAELTLYTLIPLPILSFSVWFVTSIIQQKSEKIQEQLSQLTTFTQEIFSGIRIVKAYVKEKESASKFADESEIYKEKSLALARVDALFFPLVIFLAGLSTLLMIWVGGAKVISGSLTIGNIAEFLIYISLLVWPIIAIGWVTTLVQRAAASQKRLNELFKERSEITFRPSGKKIDKASLVFDDVSFTYPDTGIKAITDVNFELPAGKKLGIVGPTGSGKSTLCTLIERMYDVSYGSIRIDGNDIRAYGKNELRGAIGYAPQDVFLFSDTVSDNIAFGRVDATQEKIEEASRQSSVYHNIIDFPDQFKTMVGERGVTLSGGQKQRISIARAWVRDPKLLMLDDVLSAVDTNTEETILRNVRKFRAAHPNTSVIMVAHRISCVLDSDLIIVLEDGTITEKGTHDELLNLNGYYARIYEKQLLEEEGIRKN